MDIVTLILGIGDTDAEIAGKLGVARQTIWRIRRGKTQPNGNTIRKLLALQAEHLEVQRLRRKGKR